MKPIAIATVLAIACSWSSAGRADPPTEVVIQRPPAAGPPRERDTGATASTVQHPSPRADPFWINGGIGVEHVNLTTFRANADTLSAGFFPTEATGPMVHLGAGFRIYMLSLGVRGAMAQFNDTDAEHNLGSIRLWSADVEATFRVLSASVEPYLLLGGGYTTVGGLDDAVSGVGQGLDVNGANARLGVGLNVRASRHLSLDARLVGELLAMSRRGVPLRDLAQPQKVGTLNEAEARVLEGDGSSLGGAVSVSVGPTLQF